MTDHNEEQHMQHERRFATIDKEIAGVKTDVGVLQADVKTLAQGQMQLQQSQDRGFHEIKETIVAKGKEPPKVGVGMMISIVGVMVSVLVVGVGAFWAAVLLLANPIREDLQEHKQATSHGETAPALALLTERSAKHDEALLKLGADMEKASMTRHQAQESQIAHLEARADKLEERLLQVAEFRGETLAKLDWIRDDTQALKQDLFRDEDRIFDKLAVLDECKTTLTSSIQELRGRVEEIARRVDQIDAGGTRHGHSPQILRLDTSPETE